MTPSAPRPDAKTWRVRLAQGYKVGMAIVLPPLLIVPAIFLLAKMKGLPEWAVFTAISTMVISLAGSAIWLVMKGIPLVDYTIAGERHLVEVLRPTFLSVRSFGFDYNEVRGFQIRQAKGRCYFTLELPAYPEKFSINAASDREEDVAQFDELMVCIAAKVNAREQAMRAR